MENKKEKDRLILMSIPLAMENLINSEMPDGSGHLLPKTVRDIVIQSAEYAASSQYKKMNFNLGDAKEVFLEEVLVRTFDDIDSRSNELNHNSSIRNTFSDTIDSYNDGISYMWDMVAAATESMLEKGINLNDGYKWKIRKKE